MSRKPIDQQQPTECRQAVWDEIRSRGEEALFSVVEIAKCVCLDQSSVREYMTGLINAGYLGIHTIRKATSGGNILFIAKRTGAHAPRVRKDGSEVTQGRSRQFMWNVIQHHKGFTAEDLAHDASIPTHTVSIIDAKDYTGHLLRAGYLVAKADRYRIKPGMWTGPNPPQVQRTKQIYDPNLQRVVWARVTGGAE